MNHDMHVLNELVSQRYDMVQTHFLIEYSRFEFNFPPPTLFAMRLKNPLGLTNCT